jgi:hypothetical protein
LWGPRNWVRGGEGKLSVCHWNSSLEFVELIDQIIWNTVQDELPLMREVVVDALRADSPDV